MKEAYYFPHDFNPTSDPKIVCLLGNYGGLGYGMFWRIIEMLHQEETHKLPLKKYIFEAIAKQMLASADQTEAIINCCVKEYELFASDGIFFWSERVNTNIRKRAEISEKRRVAGRAGAIAKQTPAKESKGKERKGKESKVNILLPTNVGKVTKLPNPSIDKIIQTLKSETGLQELDGSQQSNRRYAYLLIRKWKDCQKICGAINLGAQNNWHKPKMTSVKYLYYHLAEMARESILTKPKTKIAVYEPAQ